MADILNNPNQFYNDPAIASAQQEAQSAMNTASNYNSAVSLLPQKLKEAIQSKMDYNRDLIEQKNKAQAEYFATPSKSREKYLTPTSANYVYDPFQAEKLVAQERSLAYQPYANASDILTQRQGTLSDILNSGVSAFQAGAGQMNTAADMARQKYTDLINMAKLKTDESKWQYEQTHKSTGSGSGGVDFMALLEAIRKLREGNNETDNGVTEQKPATSEEEKVRMKNKPNIEWKSPGGQWKFDSKLDDWISSIVRLQDPQTGQVYEYDGPNDPDYINDSRSGYLPPSSY